MNKTKLITVVALLLFCSSFVFSQVRGISYTLSPSGEYTWWGDKAGLKDGYSWGGKLGFGFGQYLELRGEYQKMIDLETDFSSFGFANSMDTLLSGRPVDLERWGGELKANISRGKFLPFLTVGTGIQSITLDTFDTNKQIYISYGGGVKFSLADRYTITLSAKNTNFRFNTGRHLLSPADKAALGMTDSDFEVEELTKNWSAGAAIQFYLGGRRPNKMSDLDRAYFNSLTGGFRGLGGTLEPTVGKIEFHEDLDFRDTWFAGGSAGIDFNQYVGLRGFYYQALEDGETTKFDDLAIYGGELRMKLNAGKGLTPFLLLGGGYINAKDSVYVGRDTLALNVDDKAFAMGGVGITLPVLDNLNIFGSARAMLTSSDLDNAQNTDDIQVSWMYSAGFRFAFGKKSRPDKIVQSRIDDALKRQQLEATEEAAAAAQEAAIAAEEAAIAAQSGDTEAAAIASAKAAEAAADAADAAEEADEKAAAVIEQERANAIIQSNSSNSNRGSEIRMTPAEFEGIIEEIIENMGNKGTNVAPTVNDIQSKIQAERDRTETRLKEQEMSRRIDDLERLVLEIQSEQAKNNAALREDIKSDLEVFTRMLTEKIQSMDRKMDQMDRKIDSKIDRMQNRMDSKMDNIEDDIDDMNDSGDNYDGRRDRNDDWVMTEEEDEEWNGPRIFKKKKRKDRSKKKSSSLGSNMAYKNSSGFVGLGMSNNVSANFGARLHYAFKNTERFEAAPEVFVGLGENTSFGLMGNVLMPVKIKSLTKASPYLGTGVGLMNGLDNDNSIKGVFNILLGARLNVWKGNLYADWTGRNLFKYNQLTLGYLLSF